MVYRQILPNQQVANGHIILTLEFVGAGCPEGYIATGGQCYRIVSEQNTFNFDDGAVLCKNSGGGHPLAIHSEAENYLIGSIFGKQGKKVALGSKC